MNILKNNNTRIERLTFDDKIHIYLSSGDVLVLPLDYTSRLNGATKEELEQYCLIADGIGVHFEALDEDISLAGIIHYKMTHDLMAS
ncbi:MAG: Unknown protein [uncultured Sulfurovum sp.]|uniref:DUF2442 domain-containing protein n=1 Tax=uncultured Sulfurovum sp. TaxID=269237 RepID=A0A6S6UEY1_9BACT|nr:MAG: Unknown protein [uncultured Sulfurovum sp.]